MKTFTTGTISFLLFLVLWFLWDTPTVEAKRRKGKKIGRASHHDLISFSFALSSPNESELDRFLDDLHNPNSQSYRKFLTPEEFTVKFGPTQQQVDKIVGFLKSNGLKTVKVSSNRVLIEGEGLAENIYRAFNCNIDYYQDYEDGSIFRQPDVIPNYPEGVLALLGLDNGTIYEHQGYKQNRNAFLRRKLATPAGLSPRSSNINGITSIRITI